MVFNCGVCRDMGMKLVRDGDYRGNPQFVAVVCDCRKQRVFESRFNHVLFNTPQEYSFLKNGLESVVPDLKRHPKQGKIVERIREFPADSYLFFGLSGCGKSLLSWAIAQSAARAGKQIFFGTADELIDSFRTWLVHQRKIEKLNLRSLEQLQDPKEDKWLIMIDEIDKTKLTDYSLKTLFGIIKTAVEYGHQLIVTSNRTLEEVEDRWLLKDKDGSLDAENYASVIRRRLNEYCVPVDMRLFECENGHYSAVGSAMNCLVCNGGFAKWLR